MTAALSGLSCAIPFEVEPVATMVMDTLWSGSSSFGFTVGIPGNIVGSLAHHHFVKLPASAGLQRRRARKSGVDDQNHDLLRAVWTAQNVVLVMAREDVMPRERRLGPGGLAVPKELTDFDAWFSGLPAIAPVTKCLLRLRSTLLRSFRNAEKIDRHKVLNGLAIELANALDLFQPGSKFRPEAASSLSDQATGAIGPAWKNGQARGRV